MIVYRCDLCGEIRDCTAREIEHSEYDICTECWDALMAKLKSKGRQSHRETVTLPAPPTAAPAEQPKQPYPGAPPTITARSEQVN
jgi:ribosome-binding protein aMBF1 (putative translation factor)